MHLRVAPVVEGHGENTAIRPLLERLCYELLSGDGIDVLQPFRRPQGTLLKEEGLKAAVDAKIKLDNHPPDEFEKVVLILIDSEGEAPCILAPKLLQWAKQARSDADIACVLPHPMFETWFAAAASSLAGVNGLARNTTTPANPEENGIGKSWLKHHLPPNRSYSGRIDQPRFVAKMDLTQCRQNSPSFDKLCREFEQRFGAA